MSTERKLSNSLLLVVLLALCAYNLYSVITLKEEVASLKGETVQSEETVTPEQPSMEVIADEDVQYSCREAALKTRFSHNIHAGHDSRARGTITYTFLAQ